MLPLCTICSEDALTKQRTKSSQPSANTKILEIRSQKGFHDLRIRSLNGRPPKHRYQDLVLYQPSVVDHELTT